MRTFSVAFALASIALASIALAQTEAKPQSKPPAPKAGACVIKMNEAGPVHAGMTIRAARAALPGATFKEVEEIGGQVRFFAVTREGKHEFDLYPNQEDGIKESSKVELIRVYDPACATVEGVHPGTPLIGVEQIYGTLKKLIVEQSEKREYAQFEKLPPWLEIQAGSGDAGLYDPGQICTVRYKADARVESLWVSHPLEHNVLEGEDACKVPEKK